MGAWVEPRLASHCDFDQWLASLPRHSSRQGSWETGGTGAPPGAATGGSRTWGSGGSEGSPGAKAACPPCWCTSGQNPQPSQVAFGGSGCSLGPKWGTHCPQAQGHQQSGCGHLLGGGATTGTAWHITIQKSVCVMPMLIIKVMCKIWPPLDYSGFWCVPRSQVPKHPDS